MSVEVTWKGSELPVGKHNFGFSYSYQVKSVEPNPESCLDLSVNKVFSEPNYKLKIAITNTDKEEKGMLICIVSVPTGCKVNLNDLESLKLSNIVDYYELRRDNSEIVFYWRGVKGEGKRELNLNLLNEFQTLNRFPLFVSSYLYYDKDGSFVSAMN